ncbi:hypothetical protein ASG87_14305 [Frateuria sp. Soil773]|nr:hypothetical protein ASG87_14305 [Frateuria sp. Soil773]
MWAVPASAGRRLRLLLAIVVSLLFLPLATCMRLRAPAQPVASYLYVDDGAGLLGEDTAARLRGALAAFQAASGNQVLLLTVPSLDGDSIEQFAVKEFERRGVGRKGQDNGAMLLLAPNERRARIEVGYGLEGRLTDLRSAQILREQVIPAMRDGDAATAMVDGAGAIVATLGGDWAALWQAPPQSASSIDTEAVAAGSGPGSALEWLGAILAMVLLLVMLSAFSLVALHLPVFGWLLYPALIPFWGFPGKAFGSDGLATAGMALFALAIPWLKYLIANNLDYVGSLSPVQRKQLEPHGWRAHLSDLLLATAGGFRYATSSSKGGCGSGSGGSSRDDDSRSGSSSSGSSGSSSSSFGGGGSSGGGGASGSW